LCGGRYSPGAIGADAASNRTAAASSRVPANAHASHRSAHGRSTQIVRGKRPGAGFNGGARDGFLGARRGSSAKPLNTRRVCSRVVSCDSVSARPLTWLSLRTGRYSLAALSVTGLLAHSGSRLTRRSVQALLDRSTEANERLNPATRAFGKLFWPGVAPIVCLPKPDEKHGCRKTRAGTILVTPPTAGSQRVVLFRRRCSLSLIIWFKSAAGRISIGPSPYLKPGSCEIS
jgi:hypothetical protein